MRHKKLQNHAVLAKAGLIQTGKRVDIAKKSLTNLTQVLEQYYAKLN